MGLEMILAADTSTNVTSTALMIDDEIQEINYFGQTAQSSRLFNQMKNLLEDSKISIDKLSCLALGAGPGSFTGLRISFSAFKALAQSSNIPIILVNSLDALAYKYLRVYKTVVVLQRARKGYAYSAFYYSGKLDTDYLYLSIEQIKERLSTIDDKICIIGNFAEEVMGTGNTSIFNMVKESPSASDIALIASEKLAKGEITEFKDVLPYYLRASEAEINLQNRINNMDS